MKNYIMLGDDGLAESNGWLQVYCINQITHEYIGQRDVWVSAGDGLPAMTYLDEPPPEQTGMTIVRHGDAWELVDHSEIMCQQTKALLIENVAAKRWQVETGGTAVAGIPIVTEREDQAMLSSAYMALKCELIPSTPWKAADGSFTLVTLPMLEPIAQAVAAHVQACFSAEQAHCELIAQLVTQAELEAYDINTGWPINPTQSLLE